MCCFCAIDDRKSVPQASRLSSQPNGSPLDNSTEGSTRRTPLKDAEADEHCSDSDEKLLSNNSSRLADNIIPNAEPHEHKYELGSLKSSDQYDLKISATLLNNERDLGKHTPSSDGRDLSEQCECLYELGSLKSSDQYDLKSSATVLNDERDLRKHLPSSKGRDLSEQCECLFKTPRCSISVFVYTGDLLQEKVDAIVNPANIYLSYGGGAAKAIVTAAGRQLKDECEQYIRQKGQLSITEVMHTSAGNLRPNVRHVIHAASCSAKAYQDQGKLLTDLRATFYNCLQCANDVLKVRSVSIPAIGAGWYNV